MQFGSINFVLLFLQLALTALALQQCLTENYQRKYFKIKNCKRSDAGVTYRGSFNSLKECMNFAREKKGLAFNYSPPEAKKKKKGGFFYNCQILGCPESNNFTTLINDTLFDYYSAYGNVTVLINSTCIKSVGMFRLFEEKQNYTTAINKCQDISADLAHVLSEARTNYLSNLVTTVTDWYKAAYVGLDDTRKEGLFETALGDPISCFRYRAWSPGHPRNSIKSDDCVVIDNEKTWKVVSCKNKLPYLCELYSTAPMKNVKYLKIDCDDLETSGERKECKDVKRNRKRKNKRKNRCLEE